MTRWKLWIVGIVFWLGIIAALIATALQKWQAATTFLLWSLLAAFVGFAVYIEKRL